MALFTYLQNFLETHGNLNIYITDKQWKSAPTAECTHWHVNHFEPASILPSSTVICLHHVTNDVYVNPSAM